MPIPKPRVGGQARRPGAQNLAHQPRRTRAQPVPAVVKSFDRDDVATRLAGGRRACEPGVPRAGPAIARNEYLPAYANWTRRVGKKLEDGCSILIGGHRANASGLAGSYSANVGARR